MARLRIFVSSTYYDLKHIRRNLETFLHDMGYEPVLFESGDIPFEHDIEIDDSCYKEIENCQMQILIIGNRYGSAASNTEVVTNEEVTEVLKKKYEFYNSITKNEYLKARALGIPIFIFAEKNMKSEYETYKKNRNNTTIDYAHVDNIGIFKLLDELYNEKAGFIKDFENFDDIQNWLKEQWSGLFANYIMRTSTDLEVKNLTNQVYQLQTVTNALKQYTEALLRESNPDKFESLIEYEEKKISEQSLLNKLQEITYIKHLHHTHNFDITFLHDALKKCKTIDDFKTMLFAVDGGFSCINNARSINSLNEARQILSIEPFTDKIEKMTPLKVKPKAKRTK